MVRYFNAKSESGMIYKFLSRTNTEEAGIDINGNLITEEGPEWILTDFGDAVNDLGGGRYQIVPSGEIVTRISDYF